MSQSQSSFSPAAKPRCNPGRVEYETTCVFVFETSSHSNILKSVQMCRLQDRIDIFSTMPLDHPMSRKSKRPKASKSARGEPRPIPKPSPRSPLPLLLPWLDRMRGSATSRAVGVACRTKSEKGAACGHQRKKDTEEHVEKEEGGRFFAILDRPSPLALLPGATLAGLYRKWGWCKR